MGEARGTAVAVACEAYATAYIYLPLSLAWKRSSCVFLKVRCDAHGYLSYFWAYGARRAHHPAECTHHYYLVPLFETYAGTKYVDANLLLAAITWAVAVIGVSYTEGCLRLALAIVLATHPCVAVQYTTDSNICSCRHQTTWDSAGYMHFPEPLVEVCIHHTCAVCCTYCSTLFRPPPTRVFLPHGFMCIAHGLVAKGRQRLARARCR